MCVRCMPWEQRGPKSVTVLLQNIGQQFLGANVFQFERFVGSEQVAQTIACFERAFFAQMGRTIQKTGKETASDKVKKAKVDKVKVVPKYALPPKALLAAYPDEEGNPIYIGDKDGPSEVLDPSNLLGRSTAKNSEMLSRPGFGIAFAVTAMRWGSQTATAVSASPATSAAGSLHKAVEAQKHSKSFLRSLELLDVGKAGTISQSKAEEALNKYMRFFQESDQKLQEALVQLVVESGQLYLAGMRLLEQRAFFLKASGWGKKLRRGDVPKELAAWSQDTGNKEKLVEGLAKLYHAKCKTMAAKSGGKDKKKSTRDAETTDGSSQASEPEDSNGSSSSASRRRRPGKKDKKEKKDNKEKKDTRKKKKKSRKSSSPSATSVKSKDRKAKKASGSSSEDGKTRPKKGAGFPALNLGMDDVSSDAEAPFSYEAWTALDRISFQKDVEALEAETLSLVQLVASLDNVPDEVLQQHHLMEVRSTLKQMSRLPRKEKRGEILKAMKAMLEAAGLPPPEAKPATLQVRRITALSADGKAAIKDDDLVDEVDVQGEETVDDLIRRLLRQQGGEEDLGNRRILELKPDGKAVPVGWTTPAKNVSAVALARKGG